MIKVGKRDEKGNFTGNVTRLPLWTPYDDDINFEEEKKKLEDDKNRLNAMLSWMNDIHSGSSYTGWQPECSRPQPQLATSCSLG